ncbi:hypothetical protein HPP92_019594 [Vanilla planifolia]|uniref:Uncharacterized protein n=1 Tax=Vanilla planifolia TaxID=51239 RepID=A0A835UJZ8_VANPL|nr:hypothetical protein HPP92_019594 [Vanilla planifolia]
MVSVNLCTLRSSSSFLLELCKRSSAQSRGSFPSPLSMTRIPAVSGNLSLPPRKPRYVVLPPVSLFFVREFHLSQSYHDGLLKLQAKDYGRARELFEAVLKDPLISSSKIGKHAGDAHLLQLRFLSLKNLASVFLQQGSEHYDSALQCYLHAVEIDCKDSVVWNQLGTLSCTMGLYSTSRWAFEQGLLCSPNNWNCMEKLLEILITIGDEVACLSLADLILTHWPSHSRALHVKKVIQDAEPVSFAARGIDKLEPKHIRLRFPEKRKAINGEIAESLPVKKLKQTTELQLSGATWATLVDAILGLLLPAASNLSELEFSRQKTLLNGKTAIRQGDDTCTREFDLRVFANTRINIYLSSSSHIIEDSAVREMSQCGEHTPVTCSFDETRMTKERDICPDKEHHQERRSMRLERLRSRKLGKEDLEFSGGKDPSKVVFQTLEPFMLSKSGSSNIDCLGNVRGVYSGSHTYSPYQEYKDVAQFISKASKNIGAYHLGHLLLEEISKVNIPFQDCFARVLDIEKLTRYWGQERTPLCHIYLGELCFDQALILDNESKQQELLSEASYHLCKVIELVAMDSVNALAGSCEYLNGLEGSLHVDDTIKRDSVSCTSENEEILINKLHSHALEFALYQECDKEIHTQKSEYILGTFLLVKWLVRSLTSDKVLHKINLIIVDSVLQKVNSELMENGLYTKCMEFLSPLLLSTKDVDLDLLSASSKGREGAISLELNAIDVLLSACEKAEPMDNVAILNCHRRKLQLLAVASGMLGFSTSENEKDSFPTTNTTADLGNPESINKLQFHMVAEEVQDISRIVSKMRTVIDQNDPHGCNNSMVGVIGDIQSLLLAVMCDSVRRILKLSVSGNLNHTDQLESCLLVDASITFCKLQHLLPSVLAKAQGQGWEGRMFLKFAIKHLLALDMKLRALSGAIGKEDMLQRDVLHQSNEGCCLPNEDKVDDKDGDILGKFLIDLNFESSEQRNGATIAAEISNHRNDSEMEKVELGIENALDQSFFCLYGLNINPDSSSEEDLALHKNTSRGDYQSKEQCADVFQYVLPYARALSRAGLVKLRRVFRAIRKHFPQPPDDLLSENSIDKFLDSPDLCEDKLFELCRGSGSQEAVMNLLFVNGRGPESLKASSALGSESYMEVYGNLYYLIAQAEDTSATDKYPGFVLKREGEEFVEQNASLLKYDLLCNPLRFESWHKLANIYDEEVDLLLNDGSKHISILDWRKNASLPQRVEIGRRRSRRCLLMSLGLAKALDQQSQIHELLALVYYDNIQNVVPFYDQRFLVPKRDASWIVFCQNSMKHFEKAFALKPDWLHAFYQGKLCEKLGYSYSQAFSYYIKAAAMNPSAVDPVYRMHASRIKLLYNCGKRNLSVLQVVATHAFTQETKDKILNMFNWTSLDLMNPNRMKDSASEISKDTGCNKDLLDEAWHVLYDDCLSALQICVEGELKHFHKARYMLAQGFYKRGEPGDLERAKEELSFCFKSSRSAFTINMWEIDGSTKKGRRKYPGHGGNKRNLEVSLSESSRKFITCIRKYILFYLDLLGKTNDLSTLERAYLYLRMDKKFYLCLCDIVPIAIGKYIQVLASSIRNSVATRPTDSASLEQFLDRLFNLFIDHVSILPDLSSLPEVNDPEISETNIYGYVHQYIDLLESDIRVDCLEAINEKIRKRYKNPKLSCSNFAKICKHASLAWCRALLMKLASMTPTSESDPMTDHGIHGGVLENDPLLYVDLKPDDFFGTAVSEGLMHSRLGLELVPDFVEN